MYRYCKSCEQIKPPRTHHCSLCGVCVLRMDHHCPWVGTCVGIKNHKYFLQFLIYTCVGCAFAGLTMGYFLFCVFRPKDPKFRHISPDNMLMASVLSCALSVTISILLVMHVYFVFTSSSSIESSTLYKYNPFF